MDKLFRDYCPEQCFLLPPSPQDWMPDDHLAFLVRDLVKDLDLSAIYGHYSGRRRGAPPFNPRMMVTILLYAWCNNVFSSRRIAMLCLADLGGRYLAAGHQPDFRTISDFRLVHGKSLGGLFKQSVRLCQRAGMVSLGRVALDGTKLAANASKHKAMSYSRMKEAEDRLVSEIAEYQRRSAEADAQEDAEFGADQAGPPMPDELRRRETRLAAIRAAKAALEEEARQEAEAEARQEAECDEEGPPDKGLPRYDGKRGRKKAPPLPADSAQYNFTDPESRIMKSASGAFIQGYNGQAVADTDCQIIVACDLTNQAADSPHLQDMMEQVAENTGAIPAEQTADAGYFSQANVESQQAPFVTVLISPDRKLPEPLPPPRSVPEGWVRYLSPAEEMRRLLDTPEGRKGYAWRKKTIEPVFGQMKGCPGSPGFTQVLRRGLTKAKEEWQFACATHNFKKYMRHKAAFARA